MGFTHRRPHCLISIHFLWNLWSELTVMCPPTAKRLVKFFYVKFQACSLDMNMLACKATQESWFFFFSKCVTVAWCYNQSARVSLSDQWKECILHTAVSNFQNGGKHYFSSLQLSYITLHKLITEMHIKRQPNGNLLVPGWSCPVSFLHMKLYLSVRFCKFVDIHFFYFAIFNSYSVFCQPQEKSTRRRQPNEISWRKLSQECNLQCCHLYPTHVLGFTPVAIAAACRCHLSLLVCLVLYSVIA